MSVPAAYKIPTDYSVPSDYSIPRDATIPQDYRFPGGEVAPAAENKATSAAIERTSTFAIMGAVVGLASAAGLALLLERRRKKKDNGEVNRQK